MFVFIGNSRTLPTSMKLNFQIPLIIAGLLGFTGVALGAFGAHGLKQTLETTGQLKTWEKAVFYQIAHAIALLAVVLAGQPLRATKLIAWCWIGGVLAFSGSLYWLSLGGPVQLLWPITPLGGLALLTGWAGLVGSAIRKQKE
jgi:uncharacterized membrane protein YgdD (TMEM256/DUF423 family)